MGTNGTDCPPNFSLLKFCLDDCKALSNGLYFSAPHHIRYFSEWSKKSEELVTDFSLLEEERSYNSWYDQVYRLNLSIEQDVFLDYRTSTFQVFHLLDLPENLQAMWDEFYYGWFYEQDKYMTLKLGQH